MTPWLKRVLLRGKPPTGLLKHWLLLEPRLDTPARRLVWSRTPPTTTWSLSSDQTAPLPTRRAETRSSRPELAAAEHRARLVADKVDAAPQEDAKVTADVGPKEHAVPPRLPSWSPAGRLHNSRAKRARDESLQRRVAEVASACAVPTAAATGKERLEELVRRVKARVAV